MNAMKMKLLDELLDFLSSSSGKDLKAQIDQSKAESMSPMGEKPPEMDGMGKPKMPDPSMDEKDPEEMSESPEMEAKEKLMPGEEEMNDDELDELLKKHLS